MKPTKYLRAAGVVLGLFAALGAPPALWADEASEKAAVSAAGSWLTLVDAGRYADSWKQAATFFKKQLTPEQWDQALHSARTPLGALHQRKLAGARHVTSLPGAPEGEYVVIQYETDFENRKGAIETVTPMKEKDGSWKVSGYFIK